MDMGKNPTPFFNYLWDLEPINSSNPQILQLQKKVNYWMVIKNILDGYKEKKKDNIHQEPGMLPAWNFINVCPVINTNH